MRARYASGMQKMNSKMFSNVTNNRIYVWYGRGMPTGTTDTSNPLVKGENPHTKRTCGIWVWILSLFFSSSIRIWTLGYSKKKTYLGSLFTDLFSILKYEKRWSTRGALLTIDRGKHRLLTRSSLFGSYMFLFECSCARNVNLLLPTREMNNK